MSTPETDPDLGATTKTPSAAQVTQQQLDRTELATRALKLKHQQTQSKMVEEANRMTRHPKAEQA